MKTEDTLIPLVLMGILVLGSFVPVIQIIMLHGIAIYLYPFKNIVGITDLKILNIANLLGAILCLILFFKTEKTGYKLTWAILTIFFLNSFFTFLWDENGGDIEPYFLGFMFAGILTTFPLLVVGLVKEKRLRK